MRRSSIIPILVCMCVISATAWAEPIVNKWTDYTKPFKTRLVRISDTNIAIVKVDLPESIVENKEVILMLSSSFYSGSAPGCMVHVSVNDKELGYRSCGPDAKVVFDRRIINAGTNILKFSGT